MDGAKPPIDKVSGEVFSLGRSTHYANLAFACNPMTEKVCGTRRTVLHPQMAARAEKCGVNLLGNTPVTAVSKNGAIVGGGLLPRKVQWHRKRKG